METQFDYGNWVRRKNLLVLGSIALGLGVLSLLPLGILYQIIMVSLFAIILISFLLPLYSYFMFSQQGGKFQEKIYNLIIERIGPSLKGKILDIGSGNGVLAVKLAQKNGEAKVMGIDYWGKGWEYSKSVCEKNARIGQVENRVQFQKGDAAALEFANDTFDGAISNLTFHEVQSVADKREVVREVLRVVKVGGRFAFVDYFYDPKFYGIPSAFEDYLKGLKFSQFEVKPLRDMISIPTILRHPKILGKVGIVFGRK